LFGLTYYGHLFITARLQATIILPWFSEKRRFLCGFVLKKRDLEKFFQKSVFLFA